MRKYIAALLMLFVLTGCATGEKQDSFDFSIQGKYVCSNDYINSGDYFERFPEDIPSITFHEDSGCEMVVNYLHGVSSLYGTYSIEEDKITVEVSLEGSVFIASDDNPYYEPGTKFIDEQYVFSIVSNEEIVIDREIYITREGDSFFKAAQ